MRERSQLLDCDCQYFVSCPVDNVHWWQPTASTEVIVVRKVKTASPWSPSLNCLTRLLPLTIVCQDDSWLHWTELPAWRTFINARWGGTVSITTATDWAGVTIAVCQNSSPAASVTCDKPTWRSLRACPISGNLGRFTQRKNYLVRTWYFQN